MTHCPGKECHNKWEFPIFSAEFLVLPNPRNSLVQHLRQYLALQYFTKIVFMAHTAFRRTLDGARGDYCVGFTYASTLPQGEFVRPVVESIRLVI